MSQSLRNKLVLSHVLPILLLMPLLGLYLLYTLEEFYTQNLLQQLNYQARLARQIVESEPSGVDNGTDAQQALANLVGLTNARVLLLSDNATILASTRNEDQVRLGTTYADSSVSNALHGESVQGIGPGFFSEVAYVVLPIQERDTVRGALRVSYDVTDVRSKFNELQWLVLGGVIITTLLALGLAVGLATTITRPLTMLSNSVQLLAQGNYHVRVPAHRRDEVGLLARNLNAMAARLEELEQARQRQLAAVTHELARPLTGLRAAIETLQGGAAAQPEARQLLLTGILQELGRMQRLLESLEQAQKRALHPLVLHRADIQLDRVIRATLANYDALAAQCHIRLSAELPAALPLVNADQDRVIQVLTNLLDNAFKFTPSGGCITVRAGQVNTETWVAVVDTGTGVAPEELPSLFQEFYQGGNLHHAEKRGMGLGLTLSREILRAHGGTIQVESEPGSGTRVTFTLPKTK